MTSLVIIIRELSVKLVFQNQGKMFKGFNGCFTIFTVSNIEFYFLNLTVAPKKYLNVPRNTY